MGRWDGTGGAQGGIRRTELYRERTDRTLVSKEPKSRTRKKK